jgi:hypothetical protein
MSFAFPISYIVLYWSSIVYILDEIDYRFFIYSSFVLLFTYILLVYLVGLMLLYLTIIPKNKIIICKVLRGNFRYQHLRYPRAMLQKQQKLDSVKLTNVQISSKHISNLFKLTISID